MMSAWSTESKGNTRHALPTVLGQNFFSYALKRKTHQQLPELYPTYDSNSVEIVARASCLLFTAHTLLQVCPMEAKSPRHIAFSSADLLHRLSVQTQEVTNTLRAIKHAA